MGTLRAAPHRCNGACVRSSSPSGGWRRTRRRLAFHAPLGDGLKLRLGDENMIKNIPSDIEWLNEIVGDRVLEQIIDYAGGTQIYIPKRRTIERPMRERAILAEYNGSNTKYLARKYDITERTVRKILHVSREKEPIVCDSIKMQAEEEGK